MQQRSVDGASNREIAKELGVSPKTVNNDTRPSEEKSSPPESDYTPSGPAPNAPVPVKPPPKGPSWTGRTAQRVASDVLASLVYRPIGGHFRNISYVFFDMLTPVNLDISRMG